MKSALSRPLFVPGFPITRANLTHYYVMARGLGKPTAIGEAEFVKQIARRTWEAHVVHWGRNPRTKQLDPKVVIDVRWMTVRGPIFVLVRKEAFRGKLPSLRT